jgi:diguanylate cyclase (GGDEF)-like protein/putative nucleotidyltransferase with HDIG domain
MAGSRFYKKDVRHESKAEIALTWVVSASGLLVFAYAAWNMLGLPLNDQWLLMSLVTILVVSRLDVRIPKSSGTIRISDTFIFASLLLYGVWPSVVLAGLNAAANSLHSDNRRKFVPFNAGTMSMSVFIAGTLAQALFGNLPDLVLDPANMVIAGALIAGVHYLFSAGTLGALGALRKGRNRLKAWADYLLWSSISYFGGVAAAILIVKLIAIVSFYAFILAVPILAFTYLTYRSYVDHIESSTDHTERVAELHLRTIEALAAAIDAKDEVAKDHVRRVQIYSCGLARIFGLSEPEIEALKAGALLHDIGKLAVPDYILNKPGPLTAGEYERMKVHAVVGADILERVAFPYPVVPIVRHHHERWDGFGYPDGLRGDQIPITARILTVADCYDSLREDRQYRKAKTREEAIGVLKEESGRVFDPRVVKVFLENLTDFETEVRWQQVDFQPLELKKDTSSALKLNNPEALRNPFERIRSAHRELITLYDIAHTIAASLDLRDTFAVFSARLEDIVSYSTCALYLRAGSGELEVAHVNGRNAEKLKGKKMAPGTGIAGWVMANRQSMYNCDPQLDFDALKVDITDRYLAATVVPLLRDGEATGALALYSTEVGTYEPDHLRLVEAVAKLASDAIANAVKHEQTEVHALTDPTTGLPNARAFRLKFEEECDRALRHKDTFSVVMMDLDGFKGVNDHLGHQAGDMVLRELAIVLSAQIRSSDFISRYAGDEFVALLQAGPDEIGDLVKRIQRMVDKSDFGLAGTSLFIGISVGWACFGSGGSTLDELLIAADRSMYADKARRKALLAESGEPRNADGDHYRIM